MSPTRWIDLCAQEDLFDGASIAASAAGTEIALHCVDGVPYATAALCTHGHARLCEGFLEGFEIECPLHQGRFDVRSGTATCGPASDAVAVWPVRIEAGRVFVQWPEGGAG